MIDKYLYTIGKNLSPTNREEVLKEVKANLYDYLEENYGVKEYSDEEIESAIRTMGHPKEVAQAYNEGPRHLIGPAYIDTYFLIIKIAVFGVAIGISISSFISGDMNPANFFARLFAQLWNSSLTIIGMVTIIFGALSYYEPNYKEKIEENWDLDTLQSPPEFNEHISKTEMIISSFFVILGLYWFNNNLAITHFGDSVQVIIPGFNPAVINPVIPLINILLITALGLNIYLLVKGKWEKKTRILDILVNLGLMVVLWIILLNPNMVDYGTISEFYGSERTRQIIEASRLGGRITAFVFTIIFGYEIFNHIRILKGLKKIKP